MTYIPETLRQSVTERAKRRCEYCRLHEEHGYYTHEVDHIYAEKPGGETIDANLCLACADCNRHKGANLCSLDPETSEIVALFHPRRDNWGEHFVLLETGLIESLTAIGRVTARVLRFNRIELVADRSRLIALGGYGTDDAP